MSCVPCAPRVYRHRRDRPSADEVTENETSANRRPAVVRLGRQYRRERTVSKRRGDGFQNDRYVCTGTRSRPEHAVGITRHCRSRRFCVQCARVDYWLGGTLELIRAKRARRLVRRPCLRRPPGRRSWRTSDGRIDRVPEHRGSASTRAADSDSELWARSSNTVLLKLLIMKHWTKGQYLFV